MSTTKLLAETFGPLRQMQGRLYSEGRRTDAEDLRSLIAQTEGSVARELVKLDSRCAELRAALQECITEDGALAWRNAKFAGMRLESISNTARSVLAKTK